MNVEKRKLAGVKRGKRRRKNSELLPKTKVNFNFERTIYVIDKAVELLYRRM
jgi:hypothetical protein